MSGARPLVAAILLAATLALAAGAVAATRLTIPVARERSVAFAEHTCAQDGNCVSSGVLNCNRQGAVTVLCRIFNVRETRVQGTYRCNRLIRISFDPPSGRKPLTGLGRWHC
jgi:hypothetical protein